MNADSLLTIEVKVSVGRKASIVLWLLACLLTL